MNYQFVHLEGGAKQTLFSNSKVQLVAKGSTPKAALSKMHELLGGSEGARDSVANHARTFFGFACLPLQKFLYRREAKQTKEQERMTLDEALERVLKKNMKEQEELESSDSGNLTPQPPLVKCVHPPE
jgi:hypothetical protein